jgi:hypothetical protein
MTDYKFIWGTQHGPLGIKTAWGDTYVEAKVVADEFVSDRNASNKCCEDLTYRLFDRGE